MVNETLSTINSNFNENSRIRTIRLSVNFVFLSSIHYNISLRQKSLWRLKKLYIFIFHFFFYYCDKFWNLGAGVLLDDFGPLLRERSLYVGEDLFYLSRLVGGALRTRATKDQRSQTCGNTQEVAWHRERYIKTTVRHPLGGKIITRYRVQLQRRKVPWEDGQTRLATGKSGIVQYIWQCTEKKSIVISAVQNNSLWEWLYVLFALKI